MQQHRILSLGAILVMLLIPVIGWFLIAQPQFAAAATADAQRADIDEANNRARAAVAGLAADSDRLTDLQTELNGLRSSIPMGIDSSAYIDGLNALAAVSGVQLDGLTVSDPKAYEPAVGAPEAAAAAPEGATPAPTDTAAPSPTAAPDPAITTDPRITGESFVTIPVTIDVTGTNTAVLAFIQGLQAGDRLFLIGKLSTSVDEQTGLTGANISGFIYAIPTGVEGKPAPVSTTVKKMEVPAPVVTSTPTSTPTATGTPKPNPTGSATPTP